MAMLKWKIWAIVVILSVLLCLGASGAAYSGGTMKDLGTLPGGDYSGATAINDSGQVVGWSRTATGQIHAFLYFDGTMTDLGTLGGTYSYATGINNNGQVVGESHTASGVAHAFLYFDGTMTDLGTLGGTLSCANGINDSGHVVGMSIISGGGWRAFLYLGWGSMVNLGTLGGSNYSEATAINESDQIVGWSYISLYSPFEHAFLQSGITMTDLGTLPPGTRTDASSRASGINNAGQIVGHSHAAAGYPRAFLYFGGQMTDLGSLGGRSGDSCEAYGINNSGQIVGYSVTADYQHRAFLYSDGKMTDLGALEDSSYSEATAINDSGQIVGYSNLRDILGDLGHAFLYTPEAVAILSVSPTSLSPRCVRGKNADSQNFIVQDTGTGTLSYTITKDAAWLSVTPTSGTSTGEQDTITVNYATSGLSLGTHNATITVAAPGATGTPKTIGVTLKVNAPSIATILLLLLNE